MFRSVFSQKISPIFTRLSYSQVAPKIIARSYMQSSTIVQQPLSQSPVVTRSIVGLGAAAGVFGLCYLGEQAGNKVSDWDEYVAKRVKTTYGYFAGGLGLTALAAYGFYQSPAYLRAITRHPVAFSIGGLVVTIGSMIMTRSVSQENMPLKLASWTLFNAAMGATMAPVCFVGGPIIMRAAVYTGVVVGSLSLVAMSAHSDQFLSWGQPLAMGLGVILVTSLGRIFLPVRFFMAHSVMDNVVLYGGTALFSGFVLYDTQKIVAKSKRTPYYDPINESIGIYLDTINLFQLILSMLSNRRK